MDTNNTLGGAYQHLRNTIDTLVTKLGNDRFARAAVTIGAREAMQIAVPASYRKGFASHLSFCEALTASTSELMETASILERAYSIKSMPVKFRAELGSGQLVIRGTAMYFETDDAAAKFAHYYEPDSDRDRWTAAMTDDAEIYLAENKMRRASVAMTHTKSAEAAERALIRMAQQHFGVVLEPVASAMA